MSAPTESKSVHAAPYATAPSGVARRPGLTHAVLALAAVCAFVLAFVFAATAEAADGSAGVNGGSGVVITPKVKAAKCLRSCARKKGVRGGSLIKLTGVDMRAVHTVLFLGSRGAADDTKSAVVKARRTWVIVRVPADSATGPVVALGANGARSKANFILPVLPAPPVIGSPDLQPVSGVALPPGVTLETGTSTPRVVFLGAKQLVRFSLRVNGADATAIVNLIRQSSGEVAGSWTVPAANGQIVSVDWDGKIAGQEAPSGRYVFTTSVNAGQATTAASPTPRVSNADLRNAFDLYGYMFPVRGTHNFGQYAAKFGGGRGHQGQDVMASCGTKLVAARGGVVIESRFHSRAGNFIVIRPEGGGDMAYMHMVTKSPFKPGDEVYTGQTIGNVGQTGRASGCHLHFERWTGEIWRSKPFDPLPDLLAWDQVS
ncbi:MAG: M23 family metallopeptidase [Actinobacteria bacterium]|nr:M23 family metallopeptidase [Actinomycetota bacterium]